MALAQRTTSRRAFAGHDDRGGGAAERPPADLLAILSPNSPVRIPLPLIHRLLSGRSHGGVAAVSMVAPNARAMECFRLAALPDAKPTAG